MTLAFYAVGCSVLIFLALIFWMKWRMKASKGRFAIAVVSTLFACFTFAVMAMSSSILAVATSRISEKLGFGPIETNAPAYLVAVLMIFVAYLIYKFGDAAIKSWDVPPRLSEVNLAEKLLENSILALSLEKIKLTIKGQRDPVASEVVANWKGKISETPKPVEVKDLLRDMLVSAIREIRISDTGWRDDGKVWVGEKLGLTHDQKILALIFDFIPTEQDLNGRIKVLEDKFGRVGGCDIFALYQSSGKEKEATRDFFVRDCKVRVLSSRQLILMGLDLVNYAKELISNFKVTRVGGTSATLSGSYVDLYVQTPREKLRVKNLSESINAWLKEDSNCHIAITGEYGQGKSTALMKLCVDWANRFLETGYIGERVPLLIELRGKSPYETDPLGFISSWCTRYKLLPQQVLNLIRAGDAIVIFEGFDELRNAGKSYFRHQHFNALWRFAYPNTKLIFTGRPNFFLDEEEANRTLRSQSDRMIGGGYYSEVWRLQKLDKAQIKLACRSYESSVRDGIVASVENSEEFMEIVSRPSMLPVVATIWPEIESLQGDGYRLTGAELLEKYIQAVFSRKEAELEQDRIRLDAPPGSRYLLLPKQLRELLTICVAWRMSGLRYKNTIPRSEITDMVRDIYNVLVSVGKTDGVSSFIAEGIVDFEKRHADENLADKIEAITAEICSAGLLIPDVAGGATNLRFPHKQFFEFLLAKAIKITSQAPESGASKIIARSSGDSRILNRLINEPNSVVYLSESVGPNLKVLFTRTQRWFIATGILIDFSVSAFIGLVGRFARRIAKHERKTKIIELPEELEIVNEGGNSFEYFFVRSIVGSRSMIFLHAMFFVSFLFFLPQLFEAHDRSEINIYAVLFTSIPLALTLPISFANRSRQLVLRLFLYAHWRFSGQMPKSRAQERILTIRSLLNGEVFFPSKQISKRISKPHDREQFLYPAKDFGGV